MAKDKKESCALAVKAGVNIELPDPDCYLHLVELVKKGVLKESELDDLVAPMLFWKFEMGLFDDPYVDPEEADRVAGCDEHRGLALTAADVYKRQIASRQPIHGFGLPTARLCSHPVRRPDRAGLLVRQLD